MFLIDTSVISYFVRNNPLKDLYLQEMESLEPLFISVQTFAEIMAGAEKDNWGDRRRSVLKNYLETQFKIFPIDQETAESYIQIRNGSEKLGRGMHVADSWIAAAAKQYDLTLVTHDGGMRVASELGVKVICRK